LAAVEQLGSVDVDADIAECDSQIDNRSMMTSSNCLPEKMGACA
jgi:hypothetical protein